MMDDILQVYYQYKKAKTTHELAEDQSNYPEVLAEPRQPSLTQAMGLFGLLN